MTGTTKSQQLQLLAAQESELLLKIARERRKIPLQRLRSKLQELQERIREIELRA